MIGAHNIKRAAVLNFDFTSRKKNEAKKLRTCVFYNQLYSNKYKSN